MNLTRDNNNSNNYSVITTASPGKSTNTYNPATTITTASTYRSVPVSSAAVDMLIRPLLDSAYIAIPTSIIVSIFFIIIYRIAKANLPRDRTEEDTRKDNQIQEIQQSQDSQSRNQSERQLRRHGQRLDQPQRPLAAVLRALRAFMLSIIGFSLIKLSMDFSMQHRELLLFPTGECCSMSRPSDQMSKFKTVVFTVGVVVGFNLGQILIAYAALIAYIE